MLREGEQLNDCCGLKGSLGLGALQPRWPPSRWASSWERN